MVCVCVSTALTLFRPLLSEVILGGFGDSMMSVSTALFGCTPLLTALETQLTKR